ncbi:MAG: cupin domain-containing protein [Cyclobacteriaceae bacterium]
MALFHHKPFPENHDYLAPDTSEIRILLDVPGAGLAHCILPAGKTSVAVKHQTVNEIWYVTSGSGEIWQGLNGDHEFAALRPGVSLTIQTGNSFQFKNTGTGDLCILITTVPNWPGAHEALQVKGYWS